MGLFEKNRKKRGERMIQDNKDMIYEMINNANVYYYNQGLISDNDSIENNAKLFTRTLRENAVWNQGLPEQIEWFYKNTYGNLTGFKADTKPALSYFWAKVTPKTVRVHSGIPALISKTMVNLIAGPGMSVAVGEEDSNETDRLRNILKDNKFQDVLFPNGENMKSYGGYVGWKISFDKELTPYPILEFVQPENVEVIQKRGRKKAVIFKSIYEENDHTYELQEIYAKDEDGTPTIYYKLFKYDGADLEEVDISEEDYPTVRFNGLVDIPAGIVNNTALNQQFKGSPYGQSDYNNSQSIFNALDENLSQLMTAERFNRPKRFISEDMLPTNATGRKAEFDDFEIDYELVNPDPDEKNNNSYIPIESKIDILMYSTTGQMLVQKAFTNAGLDTSTVGELVSADVATDADSLREREKTTLRTREMKLKIWRNELSVMFRLLLQMEDLMNESSVGEYEPMINFNDFTIPSFEQRLKTSIEALNGGVADVSMAVDMAYLDDLDDEAKQKMVENIKIENGVPLTQDEITETT